jgi:hypothetical protein
MLTPQDKRKTPAPTGPAAPSEFKLRLMEDTAAWVRKLAQESGKPQSRVIIDALADYERLMNIRTFSELLGDLEVVLARHGARIVWQDLSDEMLGAVDQVLNSSGTAREAAIDQLRVIRNAMKKHKQTETK